MDSRSFTIGLVCGVIVGGLAVWLIGSSSGDKVLPGTEQAADVTSTPEVVAVVQTVQREFKQLSNGSNSQDTGSQTSAETNVEPAAPPVERAPHDPASGRSDSEDTEPRPLTENNVDPVAPWPENQRAELQSEPKDESWAYYMEQTLRQFLGAHPSIVQFDISYIECRTTKCQIEVFGFDESTAPVWQQVMYDISQQPWSEFGQTAIASGNVDGRLAIVSTLHRKSEP
jgi:hypothetical protein